jgi:hypothetical protein
MRVALTLSLRRLLVAVGCLAALALGCAHGGGPEADRQLVSVIVQAPDMQHARRAVALAGGTVTHELAIIGGVGAAVTPAQLELLHKVKDVRIHEDRVVSMDADVAAGLVFGQVGAAPSEEPDRVILRAPLE